MYLLELYTLLLLNNYKLVLSLDLKFSNYVV